jgi:hypothetical protein
VGVICGCDGPWRQAHKSLLGTVLKSVVCGRSEEATKRNASLAENGSRLSFLNSRESRPFNGD